MRALSIKQPWANMIVSGEKTIEIRTWEIKWHRGPLLIVSSKKPAIEPAGQALAIVQLADCRPMTKDDEEAACCEIYPGAWAWILEDVKRIEPFPVKGRLRLYDVQLPTNLKRRARQWLTTEW